MRTVMAVLLMLLVVLQYKLWIADGGFNRFFSLRSQVISAQAKTQKLKERNEILMAEVRDLEKGQEAVEENARRELGMIKQNEILYHVIGPDPKK